MLALFSRLISCGPIGQSLQPKEDEGGLPGEPTSTEVPSTAAIPSDEIIPTSLTAISVPAAALAFEPPLPVQTSKSHHTVPTDLFISHLPGASRWTPRPPFVSHAVRQRAAPPVAAPTPTATPPTNTPSTQPRPDAAPTKPSTTRAFVSHVPGASRWTPQAPFVSHAAGPPKKAVPTQGLESKPGSMGDAIDEAIQLAKLAAKQTASETLPPPPITTKTPGDEMILLSDSASPVDLDNQSDAVDQTPSQGSVVRL
jgi:hypothetical protein